MHDEAEIERDAAHDAAPLPAHRPARRRSTSTANGQRPGPGEASATAASTMPETRRSFRLPADRAEAPRRLGRAQSFSGIAALLKPIERCEQAAEAALARREIARSPPPAARGRSPASSIEEHELGVGRLPEQEVGQPQLAAGADRAGRGRECPRCRAPRQAFRRDVARRRASPCGNLLGEPARAAWRSRRARRS